MERRNFLKHCTAIIGAPVLASPLFSLGCAAIGNPFASQSRKKMPNVIFVVADDMGWGDTGYNGNKIQKTPALDQMAKEGVRFDRFYAACTVCAPTRASIVSGQNGARLGISHWGSSHVSDKDILVSHVMKDKGYATGHFGKWHLGLLDKEGKTDYTGGPRSAEKDFSPPWLNGYDTCFSTENVAPTWDPMKLPDQGNWGDKRREETGLWGNNYWNEKGQMIAHDDNLSGDDSRIIMDRVIPFVKEHSATDKPYFAHICFHTPHTPTISGGKYLEMYKEHKGRHHYGAITAMDEQIRRLREAIRELGEEENTLIWFCTDNGAANNIKRFGDYGGFGSNKPFRGWKGTLYEGGIRVPAILLYPAAFKKPVVVDMPCVTSDMLPTLTAILGDSETDLSQPQDGMNILPAIRGDMKYRKKPIGFAYGATAVWMTQEHKLIVGLGNNNAKPQLYHMIDDPYEEHNIAEKYPDKVSEMKSLLKEWIQSCNQSCGDRWDHLKLPQ